MAINSDLLELETLRAEMQKFKEEIISHDGPGHHWQEYAKLYEDKVKYWENQYKFLEISLNQNQTLLAIKWFFIGVAAAAIIIKVGLALILSLGCAP